MEESNTDPTEPTPPESQVPTPKTPAQGADSESHQCTGVDLGLDVTPVTQQLLLRIDGHLANITNLIQLIGLGAGVIRKVATPLWTKEECDGECEISGTPCPTKSLQVIKFGNSIEYEYTVHPGCAAFFKTLPADTDFLSEEVPAKYLVTPTEIVIVPSKSPSTQAPRTTRAPCKPVPEGASKRGRGRPKGSKNKATQEETPKRGRGRPKGSKNKPKSAPKPAATKITKAEILAANRPALYRAAKAYGLRDAMKAKGYDFRKESTEWLRKAVLALREKNKLPRVQNQG